MLSQFPGHRYLGVMLNRPLVNILASHHTTEWDQTVLDVVFRTGYRVHRQVAGQVLPILNEVGQHLGPSVGRFRKVIRCPNRHQAFDFDLPFTEVVFQEVGINQSPIRVTDPLKIIEIIADFQLVKRRLKHFSLFLDVVITIVVIFKANDDEWFVIVLANLSSIGDLTVIVDLHL